MIRKKTSRKTQQKKEFFRSIYTKTNIDGMNEWMNGPKKKTKESFYTSQMIEKKLIPEFFALFMQNIYRIQNIENNNNNNNVRLIYI